MERSHFEELVRQALRDIPDEIRSRIDNVDIVVEETPSRDQLAAAGIPEDELLLGLYDGVPLTERADYGMVLPDKISLFQDSIEAICSTNEEIIEEIKETVVHEVAHHFGIDDDALESMGD